MQLPRAPPQETGARRTVLFFQRRRKLGYANVMNNRRIEIEGDAKKVRQMESVKKAYLEIWLPR